MLLTSSLLGRGIQGRFRPPTKSSQAKLRGDRIGFWEGFWAFFPIVLKFSPFYLPRQGRLTRKKTVFTARLSCRREAIFFFILVIFLGKGIGGFGGLGGAWGSLGDTLGGSGEALGRLWGGSGEALGRLWGGLGEAWGRFGGLGEDFGARPPSGPPKIYIQTTDQPLLRPHIINNMLLKIYNY